MSSSNSELQATAQPQPPIDNMEAVSSPASSTSDVIQCNDITSLEEVLMSGERNIDTNVLTQEPDTISIAVEEAKDSGATITQAAGVIGNLNAEEDDRRDLSSEEDGLEASDEDSNSLPDLEDDPESIRSYNGDNDQESESNSGDVSDDSSSLTYAKRKTKNPKACLHGLPVELLDEILGLLLINPELGRSTSISRENNYGTSAVYGLHPYVLRVCKHLHKRGIAVLYGLNRFYAACLPNRWPLAQHGQIISSPLTRFVCTRFPWP